MKKKSNTNTTKTKTNTTKAAKTAKQLRDLETRKDPRAGRSNALAEKCEK